MKEIMNGKQDIIVSLSNLNSKEKQLLLLLIMSPKTEFSPIEISRVIGVTNRTIINRLSRLESFGFVEPILVKERIRSYRLSKSSKIFANDIVDHINSYPGADIIVNKQGRAEEILEELLIEGYSGEVLLNEFRKRLYHVENFINNTIKESKEAYKNSSFGDDSTYEIIPETTDKEYKRNIWNAATGLQAVDGLKVSQYLKKLAEDNISGIKSYEEINSELIKEYGDSNSKQKEADIVASRIAQILETCGFIMSPDLILSIHEYLFDGVLSSDIRGKFRKYNIRKKETILLGDSVQYADHILIKALLNRILDDEISYKYSENLTDSDIDHLSEFTSKLWQIHPFGEGNTRTTAVFIELYLKSLGYDVNNEPFRNHSDYYRNALVRSCYKSETYNSEPTLKYLNRFYMNLLKDSDNELDCFDLFISNDQNL